MPKITAVTGELRNHREILSSLSQTLQTRDFSLTVVFPTLSLLNTIQDELLDQPETSGIGGVRFLLFEGFIQEVSQSFGLNLRRPTVLERDLLITESFRFLQSQGKLNYLARVPFTSGYRRAILEGIGEWKRGRFIPEKFATWAAGQGEKEEQLALLYQTYQELLNKKGFTEEDLLLKELENLSGRTGAGEKTTRVILYGFTDLTPVQSDFLQTLKTWFEFEIIIDPTTIPEFQQFTAGHFPFFTTPGVVEPQPENALSKLQERLWTKEPEAQEIDANDQSLQLLQAAGQVRQASAIAREIVQYLRMHPECGVEDFLILAPEPQSFIKKAGPVFSRFGLHLPGTPVLIREFPSVNLFWESLITINGGWQWPDLVVLIRRFYAGAGVGEGDRLIFTLGERYGALSGRERWLKMMENESFQLYFAEIELDLQPLRKGITSLAAIPETAPLPRYLRLVKNFFHNPENWGSGQLPFPWQTITRHPDNYRAVQTLIGALDLMLDYTSEAFGFEGELCLKEFQRFSEDYFLTLELEPLNGSPSIIRVMPPREARGVKASVVFITGLEQGVFPRTYVNDWKIPVRARLDLKKQGIALETGDQYQLQEKLAFYWAAQAATKRLYLTFRDQDGEGQPFARSLFLDELLQWFPQLESIKKHFPLAPECPAGFAECCSALEERELWVSCLETPLADLGPSERETCDRLFRDPEYRRLALQVDGWRNRYRLSIESSTFTPRALKLLTRKFGEDFVFGITTLEDYRNCPFRFYLKHLLQIRPVPKPSFFPEGLDLGNLYHQVLKEFCSCYRGQSFTRENISDYRRVLTDCFNSFYREWQENAASDLVRLILAIQEEQIRGTLEGWMESELRWSENTASRFPIRFLEFGFGLSRGELDPASVEQPYQLESETGKIRIWGRIDRVDTDAKGNFLVYDYKTGRGPSTGDLLNFKYLQIPVYLLALEQLFGEAGKAAGGSYLGLRQPSRLKGGVWRQEELRLPFEGKSVLSEAEWELWLTRVREELFFTIQAIRSGRFPVTTADCPSFCEFKACCRRLEREVSLDVTPA